MHEDLPRRPRVLPGLPVLRRAPGEIQVGLDPRRATVVSGLPEAVVQVAHRLTGGHPVADLLDEVGPDPGGRSAMRALLHGLAEKGLVEDAATATAVPSRLRGEETAGAALGPSARRDMAVAVHGDGRLAVSVGCLLAAAGIGWVHVAAGGTVCPEDTGTGYRADDVGRGRGPAARDALRRVDATVRTRRFDTRRRPDLVLLTDAVVPDPELVTLLTGDSVPHLPVHVRDGIGVVGPLVVPGRTSCLRCADLTRAQVDRCWPRIATQLAGRPQLADLACTQATAGFAAAQALDALRWSLCVPAPTHGWGARGRAHSPPAHARPATWNASVEIDPASATTFHRGWQPHPACPCRVARHRAR